ncbi:MAG TPA: hypothetical protein VFI29_23770 [Hanamia sp.]|nr:hypothetical protein [Hanamia sp.]
MQKNEIVDLVIDYLYTENYRHDFLSHEEYLKSLESNNLNTMKELYGILKDSDRIYDFVESHIVHKDPFNYYYDCAEDALCKQKNPRKALFIIDHILEIQNTDKMFSFYSTYYKFKTECYFELQQFQLVIYCTDRVLQKTFQDSIKTSVPIDMDVLIGCFLKPRINARLELNQFKLALEECENFLQLIEIAKGKEDTIWASDVFDLKAEIFKRTNDKLNESLARQTASKIFNKESGLDKFRADLGL